MTKEEASSKRMLLENKKTEKLLLRTETSVE